MAECIKSSGNLSSSAFNKALNNALSFATLNGEKWYSIFSLMVLISSSKLQENWKNFNLERLWRVESILGKMKYEKHFGKKIKKKKKSGFDKRDYMMKKKTTNYFCETYET